MAGHDSSTTAPTPGGPNSRNAIHIELPGSQYSEQSQYSQQSEYSQSQYSEFSQSSQTTQGSQTRRLRKTGTGGGAWNAPVAHVVMTETSGQTYGFGMKTEEDRYHRLAEEARRWVLGPMPPGDFLDAFLSQDGARARQEKMPAPEGAFDDVPKAGGLEKKIYEPLARAMNRGRCPGFTFCITSEAADKSGPLGLTGSSKPDLCCFASEHLNKVEDYKPKSRKDAGDGEGERGRGGGGRDEGDSDAPRRTSRSGSRSRGGGPGGAAGSSNADADLDEAGSEGSSDAGTPRQTSPAPAATTGTQPKADSTSSPLEPVPMKRTHMGYAALIVEVKGSLSDDVFRDPKPKHNRAKFHFVKKSTTVKVVKRLGQHVSYATEMCKRQHRHFCFSVSICSHYARFIRWDRAGAIVSERFSVRDQPELLCDFLWRFAWASHAERGYDLTVEPATIQQATDFRLAIEAHVRSQGGPTAPPKFEGAVKEHFEQESVTAIHLPRSLHFEEPAGHCLLVSRPIVVPLSVAGRGTRAYWAVDSRTKRVWLLKDTWRYDAPGEDDLQREGDVLRALCAVTKNVPPVVHDEDVLRSIVVMDDLPGETDLLMIRHTYGDVQTTLTQDFLGHSWVCRADRTLDKLKRFIIKRTHYRLVLGVAGYPLLRFKDSNELLHATYDAFGALKAAFEQGKRLHRDVTPGNIILYNDPEPGSDVDVTNTTRSPKHRKGYLIDWDLSRKCQRKDSYVGDESCPVSATWQFVSGAIAECMDASQPRHTFGDDMESMIYVVLYCALLWLPLKEPESWAVKHVLDMFDFFTPWQDGASRGGVLKTLNLRDRSYTDKLQWTTPTIQQWLSEALGRRRPPNSRTSTDKGVTIMKGFYTWWGNLLVGCQGLQPAKRSDNTKVGELRHLFKSRQPAAVMDNVVHQSTISAAGNSSNRTVNKRPREGDGVLSPGDSEAGPSSKCPRLSWSNNAGGGGYLLPTSWRPPKNESIDTILAASSWSSSRASSVLRELLETDGGAEDDPDHPESDSASESGEGPIVEQREAEDEAPSEIQESATKGKDRARGVKGWGPSE